MSLDSSSYYTIAVNDFELKGYKLKQWTIVNPSSTSQRYIINFTEDGATITISQSMIDTYAADGCINFYAIPSHVNYIWFDYTDSAPYLMTSPTFNNPDYTYKYKDGRSYLGKEYESASDIVTKPNFDIDYDQISGFSWDGFVTG